MRLTRRDFALDPQALAQRLLGQRLVRILPGGERLAGVIVETEAYLGIEDRAAHSFGGRRTARVEPMYGKPGTAYVYFTYGMHHCFNVVAGKVDEPVAVLVRALRPVEGLDLMRRLRTGRAAGRSKLDDTELCSGPAKLCQALAIDRRESGIDLTTSPSLYLARASSRPATRTEIGVSPRIGVEYAGEWAGRPLRYFFRDDPNVSR